MTQVYRSDQVGSLLRPPRLLDARDAYKAGRIGAEELRRAEDAAVMEVLEMQRGVGIDVLSDGEMRRDSWQTNFTQAVDGFESAYPVAEFKRPDGTAVRLEMHTKAVCGKLHQVRRLAQVDAEFMRQHARGPFKITMPSPSCVARNSYRAGVSDAVYATPAELQREVVDIIRGEMQALAREGAGYLQLDEGFTRYVNETWRAQAAAQGLDPERTLAEDIAADNACYDAVAQEGVTLAMHLCRGSRMSWAHGPGTYEWLAERLFAELHVDRFLLEYDTAVVGGFEPLRFLPKGKIAVLGLVSAKDPQPEKRDDLMRRIEEATRYCPIEQLALSTQCGFQGAADRDGAHMTIDQERRKLELVVETAHAVWG